ncbi:MAG: radical SAM protein [Fimbriimonadaceae bacterium]|nr:radical SAM protein [Fimbriimonadaceae bacterium]
MGAVPSLLVAELFRSLQGEGRHAGRPCFFIRLAGCHLSCPWCDTPYTWRPGAVTAADKQRHELPALLAAATAAGLPLVEVTGGEPLLQTATPALLGALCDAGFEVLLDTSGTMPLDAVDPRVAVMMDLKAPGSGHAARNEWANLDRLRADRDEVKIVIADRGDYEWARAVIARYRLAQRCRVVLSPVTPVELPAAPWPLACDLAAWMLADASPAALGLQLHRLLWPAALRGTAEGG